MVSTHEGLTDDSTISHMTSTPFKKPRAQKSLCLFTNILYAKKTAYHQVGAAKSKRKTNNYGNTPWASKKIKNGIQNLMN